MSLIAVSGLSAYYENKEVFRELNFSVEEGDYLCILGENGSGKTTLMRCILGFPVKHRGAVMLNGFSRREIGWLPQKTEIQTDFPASVFEIIMSGFSGRGYFGISYSRQLKKKAEKNLELLEILNMKNSSFRDLSGGQQQRVLLCRALCSAEKLLLLDEPVTGLDSTSQNELYSIISHLNQQGMTIIMISHDVNRAVASANKILHIKNDGYFFGTTSDYRNDINGGKS